MFRRAFLQSVLGFFGLRPAKPYPCVRTFRHDPERDEFVEVAPQEIKAGDDVIAIGILDGVLDRLEYFTALSNWEPGNCPRSRENGQVKKNKEFTDLIQACGYTRMTPRWPESCDAVK